MSGILGKIGSLNVLWCFNMGGGEGVNLTNLKEYINIFKHVQLNVFSFVWGHNSGGYSLKKNHFRG